MASPTLAATCGFAATSVETTAADPLYVATTASRSVASAAGVGQRYLEAISAAPSRVSAGALRGDGSNSPGHAMGGSPGGEHVDDSVCIVNAYIGRHRRGDVECRVAPGKGRVLVARRRFEVGELLFRESPLHVVWEDDGKTLGALREVCEEFEGGDSELSWYWCALCSLTVDQLGGVGPMAARKHFVARQMSVEQQAMALCLHQGDRTDGASELACEIVKRMAPGLSDPSVLGRLLLAWKMNCFDLSEEERPCSALYFLPSLMSHSCLPSAMWHADHNNNFVLRARRCIELGEEITITYLDEDELLGTAAMRREYLWSTKDFWCCCDRCSADEDLCRGFVCPACGQGRLFARACAEPPILYMSNGAHEGEQDILADAKKISAESTVDEVKSHFVEAQCAITGARCADCGYALSAENAIGGSCGLVQILAEVEGQLHETLELWSAENATLPCEDVTRWVLAGIDCWLGQHALAYRLRKIVANSEPLLTARSATERVDLLARCAIFTSEAYPGLSAAHAWALESYADAQLEPAVMCMCADKLYDAFHCYEDAEHILTALFGAASEDAANLRRKMTDAASEVKRRLGGETAKE